MPGHSNDTDAVLAVVNAKLFRMIERASATERIDRGDRLVDPETGDAVDFDTVRAVLLEIAGATADRPGDFVLHQGGVNEAAREWLVRVAIADDGESVDVSVEPAEVEPSPRIPEAVWARFRSWRGNHLRRFDVRLADGRTVHDIGVRCDGTIAGRIEPIGIVDGGWDFNSEDIVAARVADRHPLATLLRINRWRAAPGR